MKRAVCIAAALLLTVLVAAACGEKEESETFAATVLEGGEGSLLVLADEGSGVRRSSDRFSVGTGDARLLDEAGKKLEPAGLQWLDRVEITFDGYILESYPAQITAGTVRRLPKEPLTRERVKELAEKGDALGWTDFSPYEGRDVGSGLMILCYDLAEGGSLWVGGVPDEAPWYIRLTRGDTTTAEPYIDIREASVEDFLAGKIPGETPQPPGQEPAGEEIPHVDGTASAGAAGDYPAAIRIQGKIYLVGQPIPVEVDESAIIGRTTSYTDGWPQKDGETNFSREPDLPIAQVEGGYVVLYEQEWRSCDLMK